VGVSLIVAPTLFAGSTFYWVRINERVEYGSIGGTLITLATVFWIPAFFALFGLFKAKWPRFATWGPLVAVYGCIGGAAFGLEGVFAEALRIPHDVRREAWAQFPTTFNLTFFWPGPLFPLSLLILGIMMMRAKAARPWVGILLCLGGVAFPVSRIPRIEWVAHAADGLLFIPLAHMGLEFLKDRAR
jgi:hypothetical protein